MSAQLLGARWLRRAYRITGLEPIRGWSHGGYWLGFVTAAHVHYVVHTSSHKWEVTECARYGSCAQRWGDDFMPEPIGLQVALLLEEIDGGPWGTDHRGRLRPVPRVAGSLTPAGWNEDLRTLDP